MLLIIVYTTKFYKTELFSSCFSSDEQTELKHDFTSRMRAGM